ncbi:MAG TPA: SGNH/GDSL hydrolase family protein [Candidatus Gemmiger faecigallinarum]|nr:SGNH/GDSL hydrolase family protein [Candidatus Gemmiger faecigallinarum]
MSLVRPAGPPRRLAALALAGCLILSGCQRQQAPGGETPGSATAETATTEAAVPDANAAETGADAVVAQTGAVLAETPDAGRSYVDETLFIGDSNTARYMMYADETGEAFTTLDNNIGVVSMGAGSITTLKCEQFVGYSQMYTIPGAVAMLKPRRIIIGFGTNNLSGQSTNADSFIETYLKGLEAIRDAWPYADIIVNAIPPLDKQRENQNLYMVQVDAYNAALAEMCEDNGFKFLNSAEALKDPDTGWAKKDYTLSDGVHLSKTAVTAFFEYVRTHAYVTEDRRPQPLGDIPKPSGTPVGLISQDPIAVRGAKVPVEFVASTGGSLQGDTSQLVKKGGACSTVTAVPNEGWVFAGWSASLGSAGSSASLTFTVPSNADAGGVVLTAHFTPAEHEHDWVELEDKRQQPACLYAGTAYYQCSICGAYGEQELPALGHAWDEGAVTATPQPGAEGQRTFTCTRCGEKKTEAIAALPTPTPSPSPTPAPTPTPVPEPTPTPHTHQYAETERVEPTCGAAGHVTMQCSCGASYTDELPATGQHTWDEGVVTQEPQAGVPGVRTYTCTVCGSTRMEGIPALEPSAPPEQPVDPAPPETAAPSAGGADGAAADGQTADPSGPAA